MRFSSLSERVDGVRLILGWRVDREPLFARRVAPPEGAEAINSPRLAIRSGSESGRPHLRDQAKAPHSKGSEPHARSTRAIVRGRRYTPGEDCGSPLGP